MKPTGVVRPFAKPTPVDPCKGSEGVREDKDGFGGRIESRVERIALGRNWGPQERKNGRFMIGILPDGEEKEITLWVQANADLRVRRSLPKSRFTLRAARKKMFCRCISKEERME